MAVLVGCWGLAGSVAGEVAAVEDGGCWWCSGDWEEASYGAGAALALPEAFTAFRGLLLMGRRLNSLCVSLRAQICPIIKFKLSLCEGCLLPAPPPAPDLDAEPRPLFSDWLDWDVAGGLE